MKLYYIPGACSMASHIALQKSRLPFETDMLNTATKMTASGEDYTQVNPKGYVPAIRLDDGSVLTEGVAVLQYIADQNPASCLAPAAGTMERYRLQEWLTFIATELHKTYGPLFRKNLPAEVKQHAHELLASRLGYVETQLAGKAYLMGDTFTVADAYMFVIVRWSGSVGFDLAPFPRIKAYLDRIAALPFVQAVMQDEGLIH